MSSLVPRTQETIRSSNLCHRTRLWVMRDVSPHLPRTLTQRHPWKQIFGVWPPRRSRSAACHSRTGLGVRAGGWRADVGSGGHRHPPAQAAPQEGGAGLAFLGWGRKCAAILPLLLLLQDPKGECGRTQEGPLRGLGSLIFILCRATRPAGLCMRHQGRTVGAR